MSNNKKSQNEVKHETDKSTVQADHEQDLLPADPEMLVLIVGGKCASSTGKPRT